MADDETKLNKPENTGDLQENKGVTRDEKGRIVAGSVSLNPAGKPPGARHLSTLLDEAIRKIAEGKGVGYDELLIRRLLKKAIEDGDRGSIEMIFDRLEGKPQVYVDHTTKGEPVTFNVIDFDGTTSTKDA